MKPEKELVLCFTLAQSKYSDTILKKGELGCKKDFERLLDAPQNNKYFIAWINGLIASGVLEEAGTLMRINRNGKETTAYRVNQKKLLEYLRSNPLYPVACDFFDKRSHIGILR
ncbi:hypothetical protein M0R04_09890 [Candidatus Dojkabacteria bacterium]|jgi:hypothetical protein|nr:hypothetical protein [Candidatus Dojkabacteria bacterium]